MVASTTGAAGRTELICQERSMSLAHPVERCRRARRSLVGCGWRA